MWLFTKHGFFSAVCARQGNGKHGQPVDPSRIMVRARVRGHLEALQSRFPDQLGGSEILDSGGTDYAYRAKVPREQVAKAIHDQIMGITYDNFKNSIKDDDHHELYFFIPHSS